MLEKARMKGKKPANANAVATEQGGGDAGEEDDGLCCTCGQKVGQHNHVPATNTATPAGGTAGGGTVGTKDAGQVSGGGKGK
jgi:hypothetical protein